jgi:tetratricopeptide (TPR) repeat protein
MKKLFLFFIAASMSATYSIGQVHMPQPSPTETIRQNFGLSSIELTYSRPGLKGRKFIGVIEPYNVVWRTGANAATRIKFNDPVEILGHEVDTGSYAIYTIPQKNADWTFILNRGINNDGVQGYKESEDVFREKVKVQKLSPKLETFTMQFANLRPESCDLLIKWEDFSISIPIKTNIKDKLREEIEAALQTENKPYWQAAQFYNEYDNNKTKALEMINEAINQNEKNNPFYMVYYKAKIQKDMGDKKGAIASANKSLEMSKLSKSDNYILLNKKLLADMK